MSQAIITVENLGKKYSIRHQRNKRYTALRDVIADKAKSFFRRNGNEIDATREDIWALKNVSFRVERGEVVGIIGRNGAGKSTLLKILSRITEPTEGRVRITGRVASLLEVGTGFHPELTGRENIFLNGAVLGMTRAEIKRKFDEIVDFAEVEQFLDTPVKRYSSGMYVRLAFAVAAHLEPEILVIDEVLAVGDAQFQKKCLGKMQEVSHGQGRTVLFVSHNMPAVQQLCTRGIVLHKGQMLIQSDTGSAVKTYLHSMQSSQATSLRDRRERKGNGRLRFTAVTMHNEVGQEIPSPLCGENVRVRLHYESEFDGRQRNVDVAVNMRNSTGMVLTAFANIQSGQPRLAVHRRGWFECFWPRTNLRGGEYDCALFCAVDGDTCDWIQSAFTMSIEDADFYGTGNLVSRNHGDVLCEHEWSSAKEDAECPAETK